MQQNSGNAQPADNAQSAEISQKATASLAALTANIERVIFGKPEAIERTLTALLAGGHVLIEDAPGLGKTMLARALAQSLDANFQRLQFTPDMLPTDVTGVSIYQPGDGSFKFVPGPVFSQVLLADEINRTSPRTQSALLEAMEERQVSVDGKTMPLPEVFFVIATQNPIELEGTFPLPEAQLDRFMLRIQLGYPDAEQEKRILQAQQFAHPIAKLAAVMSANTLLAIQKLVRRQRASEEIYDYIVAIVAATRTHPEVRLGVSPRGSLALMRCAQALSFIRGEKFVTPDLVKELAAPILAHRLVLDPHREFAGLDRNQLLESIVDTVSVPTTSATSRAKSKSKPSVPSSRRNP